MRIGYAIKYGEPIQVPEAVKVFWVQEGGRTVCRRVHHIEAENWERARIEIRRGYGQADEDVGEILSQMEYGPIPRHDSDIELTTHFAMRLREAYKREKERIEKARNEKEFNAGYDEGRGVGYKLGRSEAKAEAAALVSSDE